MTAPNTLAEIRDADENRLRVFDTGANRLVIAITDENEIPIGTLLDRDKITTLRDALTKWLNTTTPEPTTAGQWEAELRRAAGRSLCIGYCTECGHSNTRHDSGRCSIKHCTCNRDQNGVAK